MERSLVSAFVLQMPKYFFYVRNEHESGEGRSKELPDKDAAWREATVLLGKFLRSLDGKPKAIQAVEVEVTDELKHRLFIISIASHEFGLADRLPPQEVASSSHLADGAALSPPSTVP